MIFLSLVAALQMPIGPSLPPGVNPDLNRALIAVEEELHASRFDRAKAKLTLLPTKTVTYIWNDAGIPADQRAEVAKVRDDAFKLWTLRVPGMNFKADKNPRIKFSFNDVLAKDPDSGLPRGVALFYSENPAEPRMEAVIGLRRGSPLVPTNPISIYNEINFAVGHYLGLNQSPFLGTVMGRTDLQMQYQSMPDVNELGTLTAIRAAVDQLVNAVAKKKPLVPAKPSATISPQAVEKTGVVQGDGIDVSIQINNVGNAPLNYRIVPDCGCMTSGGSAPVPPGSSGITRIHIDSSEIAGDFNKHLILISNDIENPIRYIPVHVNAQPRYRFLREQDGVVIVDEDGLDVDVFLVAPNGRPLNIKNVAVMGNPGTAEFSPWSGKLADPTFNQGPTDRKGYRIRVHLDQPQISGRSAASLTVTTDDPKFSIVRYTIFAQRGIAALPASAFLGEIGKSPREASIVLSRPNKPFKVLKVDSDSSFVSGRVEMLKGDYEYKLIIIYNGKAPVGDLRATITVQTDDPKQAKLRIPVMGTVQ